LAGETEVLEKKLHFAYHKSHMTLSRSELEPPDLWRVIQTLSLRSAFLEEQRDFEKSRLGSSRVLAG
jgi:hypothetical protein